MKALSTCHRSNSNHYSEFLGFDPKRMPCQLQIAKKNRRSYQDWEQMDGKLICKYPLLIVRLCLPLGILGQWINRVPTSVHIYSKEYCVFFTVKMSGKMPRWLGDRFDSASNDRCPKRPLDPLMPRTASSWMPIVQLPVKLLCKIQGLMMSILQITWVVASNLHPAKHRDIFAFVDLGTLFKSHEALAAGTPQRLSNLCPKTTVQMPVESLCCN